MAVPTMGMSAVAPATGFEAQVVGCVHGEDEVVAVVDQLGGDGLAGGLVVLGILLVDGVLEASGVERLDEAGVRCVERLVLGQL